VQYITTLVQSGKSIVYFGAKLRTIHGSEPSFLEAGTTRKGAARRLIRMIEPPIAPNPTITVVVLLFGSPLTSPISQYSFQVQYL